MKLIIAIVANEDANKVQKELVNKKIFATRLATTGSFLRARNVTFLVGVNDEKTYEVMNIIEACSKKRQTIVPKTIVNEFGNFESMPQKVEVGGATVFIVNVDQFIKV